MKKIKLLALVLAVLTVISCFAACGGGGSDETQDPGNNGGDDVTTYYGSSVPTSVNFSNLKAEDRTVNILVRKGTLVNTNFEQEMDCDASVTATIPSAIYNRNREIESKLGVTIKQIAVDATTPSNCTYIFNEALKLDVLGNNGAYDAAAVWSNYSAGLSLENCYLNLMDTKYIGTSIKEEKPYVNKTLASDLTFEGTLFFLAGDITVSTLENTTLLAFNKDLFEDKFAGEGRNMYQMVYDYEWTIDQFSDIVYGVYDDVNTSGLCDSGDIAGIDFCAKSNDANNDAWMAALGVKVTSLDSDGYPILDLYVNRTHTQQAYEKFNQLVTTNRGVLREWGSDETGLNKGNMLFQRMLVSAVSKLTIPRYGILPLPMFDETQGEYMTATSTQSSLVVMMSTLKNKSKKDVVDATLDVMNAASAEKITPVYKNQVLKGQQSQSPDDSKMFDIILPSVQFGFGQVYSFSRINAGSNICPNELFRNYSTNISQYIDANASVHEGELDDLVIALMEMATGN